MDLLGSILNSMDKPPSVSNAQKAIMKKQREELEKRQQEEAESLKNFREKVEKKVNEFLKNDSIHEFKFGPMNNVYRSVIHDVCEIANVLSYSFGDEDIDRHVVIFKKEHAPSEDHLNALRRGEEWNEEIAEKLQKEREELAKEKEEEAASRKRKHEFVPNSNYKDKYEHLIGKEAAIDAAKKTEANSSYGCVPSENKKDQRSIEQTLADIKEKRRKLQESEKTG